MNYLNQVKNSFLDKFRSDRFLLPVIVFCLIFLILSSVLPFFQVKQDFLKFFSPDENANYIFTKLYQESGQLSFFEKYNVIAEDVIRPRSYFSHLGLIKPVSFLGLIIFYGQTAKILGPGIIPFLTPIWASLALFFYYLLIRKLFDSRHAFISFLLFWSFPVWLYYSSRSLFHNVLFLSFFIIGLYFLVACLSREKPQLKKDEPDRSSYYRSLRRDWLEAGLSGIFLALAVGVRTSELIWLLPAGLLLLGLNFKRLSIWRVFIMLSGFFLAWLPIGYYNQVLYDSPFYGGYREMNHSLETVVQAGGGFLKSFFSGHLSEAGDLISSIFNTVFYFGFYPRQSLFMFFKYGPEMFWYIFLPAVAGAVGLCFLDRTRLKKIWTYVSAWLLAALILLLYYGSWKFTDNPDPNSFTIGNSYTRYWLPIYIGLFPLAACFILAVKKNIQRLNPLAAKLIAVLMTLFIILLSFRFVYSGSAEGLKYYFAKSREARQEVQEILALTESQAVLITEYHDKFLFPERKVIVGRFDDNNMIKNYQRLLHYLPLYYYNFSLPDKDFNYLNDRRLKEFDLKIDLVREINSDFSLYRLSVYDL